MKPTRKDYDDLFSRLANAGWIHSGCVIDDPSLEYPFALNLAGMGQVHLFNLYRVLNEIKLPTLTDGEWAALFRVIVWHGQRHKNPDKPSPDQPENR